MIRGLLKIRHFAFQSQRTISAAGQARIEEFDQKVLETTEVKC